MSTNSGSSAPSSYWFKPISIPRLNLKSSPGTLANISLLGDGAAESEGARYPTTGDERSIVSDGSTTHRRRFVFGTPTGGRSSGGQSTPDNANQEIGMSPVRDNFGKTLRSSISISSPDSNERMNKQIGYRGSGVLSGGNGSSAWLMFDTPDDENFEYLPSLPRVSRATSKTETGINQLMTCNDGSASEKTRPRPRDTNCSPPNSQSSYVGRRSPSGSKFQEDLPGLTRSTTPFQWIKDKAKSTTSKGSIGALVSRKSKTVKSKSKISIPILKIPGRFRSLGKTTKQKTMADPRDLKVLTPRPSFSTPQHAEPNSVLAENGSPIPLSRRNSGLKETVVSASRRFSSSGVPTPEPANIAERFHYETPISPPLRSHTAPPNIQTLGDLEFLPSEATGVATPPELPKFNPKNIGSFTSTRKKEFNYFADMNMIQSKPPMAAVPGVGEMNATPDPGKSPGSYLEAYQGIPTHQDINAIAPFLQQDLEIDRRSPRILEKYPVSKQPDKVGLGLRLRRASMGATMKWIRRLSDVSEISERRQSATSHGNAVEHAIALNFRSSKVRSRRSIVNWIRNSTGGGDSNTSFATASTSINSAPSTPPEPVGPLPKPKPVEVLMEQEKRKRRDSDVIGLNPSEQNSFSDDSFTYAAASRNIVGLQKHPQGPAPEALARDYKGKGQAIAGPLETESPATGPESRTTSAWANRAAQIASKTSDNGIYNTPILTRKTPSDLKLQLLC
ncbi:hypothetical protein EDC01DRAFT_659456 [Geopyxis carbonaria]|nr:hypothetical protein EDC01DRAFT_659456 [Geopyxis carbonaria]